MKEIKMTEWIWKKKNDDSNPQLLRIPIETKNLKKGNYLIKIYRLESETL